MANDVEITYKVVDGYGHALAGVKVNVRAENEITKILIMLDELHAKLGISKTTADKELEKMEEEIDIAEIQEDIEQGIRCLTQRLLHFGLNEFKLLEIVDYSATGTQQGDPNLTDGSLLSILPFEFADGAADHDETDFVALLHEAGEEGFVAKRIDEAGHAAAVIVDAPERGRGEVGRAFRAGNGEAMVANKVHGVRCALCWNEATAKAATELYSL